MAKATPRSRIGKKKKVKKTSSQDHLPELISRILHVQMSVDTMARYLAESRANPARDLLLELYDTVRQTGIDVHGEDLEPAPGTIMYRCREFLFGKTAMETVRGTSGSGDPPEGFVPDADSEGDPDHPEERET
jgi:hypothetical protein